MKDLISVIVPVYNVENYLEQCVNSILQQTYDKIEIILVDDGSTDSSGKICDDYAKASNKIAVYHKKNGGLMSAWKYGVGKANGEFIGFIDSDDWIDADMYERLFQSIVDSQADISVCGLVKGEYIYTQPSIFKGRFDAVDVYPKLINNGEFMGRGVIPSRVVKLFKREIVVNTLPYCIDEITIGEDMIMNFAAFMFAKRVVFLNDYYPYHYRINLSSISQKFNKNCFDKIKLFNSQLRFIANDNEKNFTAQIDADLVGNAINTIEQVCCSQMSANEKKEYIKRIIDDEEIQLALSRNDFRSWNGRYKSYYHYLKKKSVNGLIALGNAIKILRKVKAALRLF